MLGHELAPMPWRGVGISRHPQQYHQWASAAIHNNTISGYQPPSTTIPSTGMTFLNVCFNVLYGLWLG